MIHLLPQTILETALRLPDKIAFKCGKDQLTYAELATKIQQLATVLRDLGVKKGDLVGLFLNRSIETAIATHGVMLAGGAYVPLNPRAPVSVNQFQIKEGNFKVAITNRAQQKSLATLLRTTAGEQDAGPSVRSLKYSTLADLLDSSTSKKSMIPFVVGADNLDVPGCRAIGWEEVFSQPESFKQKSRILSDDLAYIMYTSGSTGTPKGMMHTHRSGLGFARLMAHHFQIRESDVFGSHAPIYFDVSTPGLFTAPLVGATTVIVSDGHTIFPTSLSALFEAERISVWYSVPLALIHLLEKGELEKKELPDLRHILYAGEPFAPKYLRRLMHAFPQIKVSNLYGPAETNVCTYYDLPGPPTTDEPIPIGDVWKDTDRIILDEKGEEIYNFGTGELCIRSVTTMAGYLKQPELTERAFYQRFAESGVGEKFYKTGDLVELDQAGLLHFRGRRDHQLKIRGYRVEPDAVETRILAHSAVSEAAIITRKTDEETLMMVAAVILKEGSEVPAKELMNFVGEEFPWYAIPEEICFLSSFPRTGSGKVDRGTLAELI